MGICTLCTHIVYRYMYITIFMRTSHTALQTILQGHLCKDEYVNEIYGLHEENICFTYFQRSFNSRRLGITCISQWTESLLGRATHLIELIRLLIWLSGVNVSGVSMNVTGSKITYRATCEHTIYSTYHNLTGELRCCIIQHFEPMDRFITRPDCIHFLKENVLLEGD